MQANCEIFPPHYDTSSMFPYNPFPNQCYEDIEFDNFIKQTLFEDGANLIEYNKQTDNVSVSTRTSSMADNDNNSTTSEEHKKYGNRNCLDRNTSNRQPDEKNKLAESYKMKYKTEMCKNFDTRGFCKWGNNCCFAHGKHELRQKKHLNSKYKSKICKHYHKSGHCPYGLRYVAIKSES